MVQLTTKELKELLEIAFDRGWMGYCDLKEAVVQELLEKYKDQELKATTSKDHPLFDGQVWIGPEWSTLDANTWTINYGIDPSTENSS